MEEIAIEQKQANKYDKIVKENMKSIWPVLMKDILNLDIAGSVAIPGDIQHTNERKPDVLAKITGQGNHTFVLHIEWQSKNDKNMAYRMAEYAVMLHRKYRLPIEQFVIYMGKNNVTMAKTIRHKHLKFRYHIISLKDINYRVFLKSDDPGSKVFAILANFGNDSEDEAIENIVKGIEACADGELEGSKYFNQLRIFVQLCNGNIKLKLKNMISTRTFFRKEKDLFFVEGVEVGEARGEAKAEAKIKKQHVKRLRKLGHDVKFISYVLGIPVEEVEEVLKPL